MILNILKKYYNKLSQKKIVITMINALNINQKQKDLYLESLDFLDENGFTKLYESLKDFVWQIEQKNIEDLTKGNFVKIEWMRKKEAIEKQQEINNFW